MLGEFKAFIARGNVLDLAVGVIIGAAFGKIVSSLTDDLIMPLISLVTGGGTDFSAKYIILGGAEKVQAGMSLAAAKAAGANVFAWGSFITAIINFLILAFVILHTKQTKMLEKMEHVVTSVVDMIVTKNSRMASSKQG